VFGCVLVLLASCSEDEDEALTTHPQRVFGYGSLEALVVSPDGRHFITGGGAGAYVWDLETGKMIQPLRDRYQHVTALAISPDGRQVITADGGQYGWSRSGARLWDLNTGDLLQTLAPTNFIEAVAFSPDGKQVLTGGAGSAQLWDPATAQIIREFGSNEEAVESVAFSVDGVRVATGSPTNVVRVWETETGRLLLGFTTSSTEHVSDLEFSPDGTRLLTAGDRGAQLWDLATGALLVEFGSPGWAAEAAFSPDGLRVLTAGGVGLRMWDAATGEMIPTFKADGLSWPADFTPDGRQIAAGESWEGGTACLLDAQSGQLLRKFPGHSFGLRGKGDIEKPLALSPDGSGIVMPGSSLDRVTLWDVRTGQSLRDFNHDGLIAELAAFSPDSKRLLASSWSEENKNTIQLWDVATGELLRAFTNTNYVECIGFSPDGRQILAQDYEAVTLWDGTTGQLLHRLPFPPGGSHGPCGAPSFSSDSSLAMVVGSEVVDLWDAQQGIRLRSFWGNGQMGSSAIFSPDGRHILIGGGDQPAGLALYSIETGATLQTFEHAEPIRAAAFSPDGLRVVGWEYFTTLDEGTQLQFARAVVWDAATAQPLRVFKHVDSGGIERACFSADAKWLLIAGPHCVRLWDAATGDWLRSFEGESPAWFLPDGKAVLTASGPGSGALWDIRDLLARPRIQRDSSGVEVAWDLGTLQYAPTVNGPWSNLVTTSPLRVNLGEGQSFYRVRVDDSRPGRR
jgi:WD40 repeat protein